MSGAPNVASQSKARTAITGLVELIVLGAAAYIINEWFNIKWAILVLIVGGLSLILLHRDKLQLANLSDRLLGWGVKNPLFAFLIVVLGGGLLGATLFGGSWLWMIHEYKKNPPLLPPSPPSSIPSKPSTERTPTAAEIAEEVAKKLPSIPTQKPKTGPPAPGTQPSPGVGTAQDWVAIKEAMSVFPLGKIHVGKQMGSEWSHTAAANVRTIFIKMGWEVSQSTDINSGIPPGANIYVKTKGCAAEAAATKLQQELRSRLGIQVRGSYEPSLADNQIELNFMAVPN